MKRNRSLLLPGLALLLIGVSAAFLSYWKGHQRLGQPGLLVREVDDSGALSIQFPKYVLDFESNVREVSDGVTGALPEDTTIDIRLYRSKLGAELQLMGVLMGSDRTSIHQPQFCLTGAGFKIIESIPDTIEVAGETPYSLPVMILRAEKEIAGATYSAFYIYWFVADGLATAEHWERMWLMAKGLFSTGELQRWAYVSLFGVSLPDQEDVTLAQMKSFLQSAIPEFQPRPASLARVEPAETLAQDLASARESNPVAARNK